MTVGRTSAQEYIDQWVPMPVEKAETMVATMYTDPEVFKLEQERLFGGKTWLAIGGLHQLDGPGSYFTTSIAGQPLLIVKDQDDRVRAFFNVCPHRGGMLASDACGSMGRSIQCQYHGWSFGLDGALRTARDFEGVEDFDPDQFGLRALQADTWEQFIFVSFSPDAPPLLEFLGDMPERLERYKIGEKVHAFTQEYEERANWKLVWENAAELYHLPFIHPQLPVAKGTHDEVRGGNYSIGVSGPPESVDGANGTLPYLDVNLFPNFNIVGDDRSFVVAYIVPHAVDRTGWRLDGYAPQNLANDERFKEGYMASTDGVNVQDIPLNESVHRNLQSFGFDQGRLSVRWESQIHHFQNLLMGHLRDGS